MAFKDSVIRLYLSCPDKSIDNIALIAGCSDTLVSQVVSEYLQSKRDAKVNVMPKTIVEPFVLMTHNENVLSAYYKMINPVR